MQSVNAIKAANNHQELMAAIEFLSLSVGAPFYRVGFLHCESFYSEEPSFLICSNCNHTWNEKYSLNRLSNLDPIVYMSCYNGTPILWSELSHTDVVPIGADRLMITAKQHGLQDGISLSFKGPRGDFLIFSLITNEYMLPKSTISSLTEINGIMPYILDAFIRLSFLEKTCGNIFMESERLIFSLCSQGVSVNNIAQLTGIKKSYVKLKLHEACGRYLKPANEKLYNLIVSANIKALSISEINSGNNHYEYF